jgi:hypothetical protein
MFLLVLLKLLTMGAVVALLYEIQYGFAGYRRCLD